MEKLMSDPVMVLKMVEGDAAPVQRELVVCTAGRVEARPAGGGLEQHYGTEQVVSWLHWLAKALWLLQLEPDVPRWTEVLEERLQGLEQELEGEDYDETRSLERSAPQTS
jgi:hypothetical protein